MMDVFCKNREWVLPVNYFRKKNSNADVRLNSKNAFGDKMYRPENSRKLRNSSLCYGKLPSQNISLFQFLGECFKLSLSSLVKKSIIQTAQRRHWRYSGLFIVNVK